MFPNIKDIAAVIVTFNRSAELRLTLDSVGAQGIQFEDIFVINNNSNDDTELMMKKYYSSVNFINLADNIASAGGFAMGMQIVHKKGYKWAWLFNDDSRPMKGALDSLISTLITNQNIKIGLLKIGNLNKEGKATLLFWNGVRRPVYIEIGNEMVETDLVTFDGCLVSAQLMTAIGYCDPLYFMGTYEFDYCLKVKEAGYKIYTIPNGLIEDGKLGSEGGTPPWRQYYNTRNHLWLGLHRRSFQTLYSWLTRELKYTYHIVIFGNQKRLRLLYKFRAVRDALLNKRGRRY